MAQSMEPSIEASKEPSIDPARVEDFDRDGFVILRSQYLVDKVAEMRKKFNSEFLARFTDDLEVNKNLLRRFGNTVEVSNFLGEAQILAWVRALGLKNPVFSGPAITGYTSFDRTGRGWSTGWHQDWPGMATSLNSVVIWTNLVDSSPATHSLVVAPGMHNRGILPGNYSDDYGLLMTATEEILANQSVLSIKAGEVLFMSAFLPHSTFVNPQAQGEWKMSLNRRMSDLDAEDWIKRGYIDARGGATKGAIDWQAYLK